MAEVGSQAGMGHLAKVKVEPVAQPGIRFQRLFPSFACNRQHVGQGSVGQCLGAVRAQAAGMLATQ